jgi:vacuolar protein sorting-associated protein 29
VSQHIGGFILQKVLVFGDTHMPTRATSIPKQFYKHIDETAYDLALITGDLVREASMKEALPPLPRHYIVVGNMDYSSTYNFHELIQIENIRFLLIHGTQLRPRGNIKQLYEVVTSVEADVAVHGHTHKSAIDLHRDRLFLNPGTISGAGGLATGWSGKIDASFMELEITDSDLLVILHLTDWKVIKKSEARFRKQGGTIIQVD